MGDAANPVNWRVFRPPIWSLREFLEAADCPHFRANHEGDAFLILCTGRGDEKVAESCHLFRGAVATKSLVDLKPGETSISGLKKRRDDPPRIGARDLVPEDRSSGVDRVAPHLASGPEMLRLDFQRAVKDGIKGRKPEDVRRPARDHLPQDEASRLGTLCLVLDFGLHSLPERSRGRCDLDLRAALPETIDPFLDPGKLHHESFTDARWNPERKAQPLRAP